MQANLHLIYAKEIHKLDNLSLCATKSLTPDFPSNTDGNNPYFICQFDTQQAIACFNNARKR